MEKYKNEDSILVYCGATSMENEDEENETVDLVRQIDGVTEMINKSLGMRAHRFTAEEDLYERQEIKKYFQNGLYQVITAIKCLDEGVNIPGIKTAFIQRRGRLLRKSSNKEFAEIYDFVTLPRKLTDVAYDDFERDRSIIIGELYRINEFAKLADNRITGESLMTDIMNSYSVFFDIDEEIEKMEEYYDG